MGRPSKIMCIKEKQHMPALCVVVLGARIARYRIPGTGDLEVKVEYRDVAATAGGLLSLLLSYHFSACLHCQHLLLFS